MPADSPSFPENRFAENRAPDPKDGKTPSGDVNHTRKEQRGSEALKKPRRFSRKDVEEGIPPDPDPDDPVSP